MKANQDIRAALKQAGVFQWQLGVKWGCNEQSVVRRLRIELPDSEKKKVFQMIDQIKAEQEASA